MIDGFGNHNPGGGRYNQKPSRWDVLHPGRPWAERLLGTQKTEQEILDEVTAFLEGRCDESSLTSTMDFVISEESPEDEGEGE